MSKEFHVFTFNNDNHEQAVVFEVDRDNDNSIELGDVYLVSSSNMGELKTKLNMQNIIGHILENKGGNINDTGVEHVMDVFTDFISDEHKQQIKQEMTEKQTNVETMNPERLIVASELISGLNPDSYPELIEKMKRGL